jgi:hypothetical protein
MADEGKKVLFEELKMNFALQRIFLQTKKVSSNPQL